jgi:hypothetical protein
VGMAGQGGPAGPFPSHRPGLLCGAMHDPGGPARLSLPSTLLLNWDG